MATAITGKAVAASAMGGPIGTDTSAAMMADIAITGAVKIGPNTGVSAGAKDAVTAQVREMAKEMANAMAQIRAGAMVRPLIGDQVARLCAAITARLHKLLLAVSPERPRRQQGNRARLNKRSLRPQHQLLVRLQNVQHRPERNPAVRLDPTRATVVVRKSTTNDFGVAAGP